MFYLIFDFKYKIKLSLNKKLSTPYFLFDVDFFKIKYLIKV